MTIGEMTESIYNDIVIKKMDFRPAVQVNNTPIVNGTITENALFFCEEPRYIRQESDHVYFYTNDNQYYCLVFLFDFTNMTELYVKASGNDPSLYIYQASGASFIRPLEGYTSLNNFDGTIGISNLNGIGMVSINANNGRYVKLYELQAR